MYQLSNDLVGSWPLTTMFLILTNMAVLVGWITEFVREILQISGLTLLSVLVLGVAFLLLVYFLLKRRPRNLPPYPAGRVPLLGHLLALGRAPHLKLTAWRRQYGDVFTVRMGMEDVVVLNGYTAVKDALVDRSELFASRPENYMIDVVFGYGKGVAVARWGAAFKQRRKFSHTALKTLGMKVGTGSIEEKIREEASCLRNRMAGYEEKPVDVLNDVSVSVANVICGMTFGKCYNYEDETFRELLDAISNVSAELGSGQIISVFPLLRFVPGINRTCKDVLKQNSKIQEVLLDEIARHRENLDRENPRDFLDACLLELELQEKVDGLTEENVMYLANDLFIAGTETTTTTLLWSLLFMTLNPDIQSKVQQELDAVVGEGLPALSHRSQLPYVSACLLEVMRIRTLGPLSVPHATTEAVNVQGYHIPKGTQVLPNLYSLHMDPAYWPDPERFDPGRFLDAEGNVINKPESFMPFGGGRRVCLGEQLARMELFLFFSTLLQFFTFRTPEGANPPTTDGIFGPALKPHPFQLCAISR
ncbi:PREDICTED: cytochrome P450 2U1-like isoform X1 [Branchiostoma belcheri]|uniref:Cytochrome P450 2U1-like isoform X1 n=1 Tax=Branchiostoma belcheri TaxID=7741 RepID=A0A6P4YNW9_BRABE|nr:PREDICTED: cytochrome P450 2U1-like isoform X1 [Branchiostoma belcheri]